MVSRIFLTGFASTALFGPAVGRAIDTYGRKKGTLAFTLFYAMGALSTKSPLLLVLLFGRVMSGIGTSLLFSAPESWLVGEAQKSGDDPDGEYLGETFGLAYAGDSVVAICAGQLASLAANKRGPTGPFELSTGFLLAGGLLKSSGMTQKSCMWEVFRVYLRLLCTFLCCNGRQRSLQPLSNPSEMVPALHTVQSFHVSWHLVCLGRHSSVNLLK